jgi:D-beta-D-heptose 7-phosphate kinase/D-beta-D-heptose 1-phosphate adenosyltransferase
VAVNVAALGARVSLLAGVGADEAAGRLETLLAGHGVRCRLERREGTATITKLRVMSRHQQLIRLDFEDPGPENAVPAGLPAWDSLLAGAGVLVLSDYAKGALAEAPEVIRRAREQGVAVVVDPKGRDFLRYRGATVVTPNVPELEAEVGPWGSLEALVERGQALRRALGAEALLVTRSEHGMSLLTEAQALHLPAQVREVYDVTGAGDTVVAVLAAALAAGAPLADATRLANLAAGVVVGKLGTASVSAAELEAALRGGWSPGSGALDEAGLQAAVGAARRRGERIVLTNGCFDILHAGHVRYLEEARRLGDRLVVAVNDDASVERLKGPGRPVNTLAHRMAVLQALASVDWVVPFSEDTPERLICALGPDMLVKGGDYRPEDIAGGDCVTRRGGRVVVLGYQEGCSTTGILESLGRRGAPSGPSG